MSLNRVFFSSDDNSKLTALLESKNPLTAETAKLADKLFLQIRFQEGEEKHKIPEEEFVALQSLAKKVKDKLGEGLAGSALEKIASAAHNVWQGMGFVSGTQLLLNTLDLQGMRDLIGSLDQKAKGASKLDPTEKRDLHYQVKGVLGGFKSWQKQHPTILCNHKELLKTLERLEKQTRT